MLFKEFNDDEEEALKAKRISRALTRGGESFQEPKRNSKEAERDWRAHCKIAIRKCRTQEFGWCLKEAQELDIPSNDPTLIAVQKSLHAYKNEEDHHPTRTELIAKEPSSLTRTESGHLSKMIMLGDHDVFLEAISQYIENLNIVAETLEPSDEREHLEQLRKSIEAVWLHADVDEDDQLSSTEAWEVIRVFLSRPQIREFFGEALFEKTKTIMKKDDGLRQTWIKMGKESATNGTRTLNQLCKRSVSQACLDMARSLPQVTDAFWDAMDIDKNGHVIAEEFIQNFEKAARTHLIKPVFKIAEERVWDIILSDAWKENEFETLDRVAKDFRKRKRKLGVPAGPRKPMPMTGLKEELEIANNEEEIEKPGEWKSCNVCSRDDCVIC